MKKREFTLTHLLIIVSVLFAIIVIAMPFFTAKLDKIKEEERVNNIRASYAESFYPNISEQCGGGY